MSSLRLIAGFLLLSAAVGGCSTRGPQTPPARLVQRPDSALNEVDLRVKALPPVGDAMPVLVTIANITRRSFSLNADKICAVSADGNRVLVIQLAIAERSAGGAGRLAVALPNLHPAPPPPPPPPSTGQTIADFCLLPFTAKTGGDPRLGAAWIMFVCPTFAAGALVYAAIPKSEEPPPPPPRNLGDDLLPSGDLPSNRDIQGYIFLPRGNYSAIEVPITYLDSAAVTTIVQAWDSAKDLVPEGAAATASVNAP